MDKSAHIWSITPFLSNSKDLHPPGMGQVKCLPSNKAAARNSLFSCLLCFLDFVREPLGRFAGCDRESTESEANCRFWEVDCEPVGTSASKSWRARSGFWARVFHTCTKSERNWSTSVIVSPANVTELERNSAANWEQISILSGETKSIAILMQLASLLTCH